MAYFSSGLAFHIPFNSIEILSGDQTNFVAHSDFMSLGAGEGSLFSIYNRRFYLIL